MSRRRKHDRGHAPNGVRRRIRDLPRHVRWALEALPVLTVAGLVVLPPYGASRTIVERSAASRGSGRYSIEPV
jgi:hypothetical protein